ncbi:glycosyltransferase family 4 protein [Roseicyclus persicicus]|uniref:Glycosyltransferase family 4 protein n=1 Tax=Roseicyclus persicicus TaxID=2650661 RepID=A0A7X6GYT4_9RHOB|nr:glycosyltransferase family 4 protein [Roseibacterium persicicum]NKX44003.1 glycosyltransferase family 4 protein [Roseibacterium persicicum]
MQATRPAVYGGILCADPPITLGKRRLAEGAVAGLVGDYPELFEGRASYHILTLAWAHDRPAEVAALAADLARLRQRLPLARVLVLANSEAELQALRGAGIAASPGNLLAFGDESIFRPVAPAEPGEFDAVYVAVLEPYKRHALAAAIDRAMLVYWRPTPADILRVMADLPRAEFINHRLGDGAYRALSGPDYAGQLARARVGLCLSEREGPMRASIEYALCGLPIVTTEATGGRLEMLPHPFARVVPADPAAVAAATAELAAEGAPREAVRAAALARLRAERDRVMQGVADWLRREAGADTPVPGIADMIAVRLFRDRPPAVALAPLWRG